MKYALFLFLISAGPVHAQKMFPCSCKGFVDKQYPGSIAILDSPNGKLLKNARHDLKNRDYLVYSIDKVADSFYHVKMQHAIAGKPVEGWIKKSKYLVTYLNRRDSMVTLYSEPNAVSKIKTVIPGGTPALFQIFNCTKNWIYIRKISGIPRLEGWLAAKNQCADPGGICD